MIISGDFNAQLGQNDNGNFPYSFHQNTNRNGNILNNYILENNLICLNTHFQKRCGQSWTHTSPNASNSQIDDFIINRKWKNSAINCRAYNSFISVATDHRIVSAHIRLSLRVNKTRKSNRKNFERSELRNNSALRSSFVIKVQNRFEALQTSILPTANSICSNFEIACKEIAAETIPLKPKTKRRIPWENLNIRNKRKILHEAAQQKDNNPTIENIRKTCNAQKELSHTYETEQSEYIQGKICQVQDAANNKKSALAWKIVNEISGRKNSNKSKLKASNDEERVKLWQTHFEDLLGKPPKPTHNSNDHCITILHKLDIKIGPFTTHEIDIAIKNIKNGKATGLYEIPSEVWKIKEFQDILLKSCNSVYSQDPIERWTEGCILPFPKKKEILP